MKNTTNNIENVNSTKTPKITATAAKAFARAFMRITKQYKAAEQEIKSAMEQDLEQAEIAKKSIKEYGIQQGDKLFKEGASVNIIDGVQLVRSAQQPAVDLRLISSNTLNQLISDYPQAFKVDLRELQPEDAEKLNIAIANKEPHYTYTLKLVAETKKKSNNK